MINLKINMDYLENIEPTLPVEDKVLDVNDPEDKGPYIIKFGFDKNGKYEKTDFPDLVRLPFHNHTKHFL